MGASSRPSEAFAPEDLQVGAAELGLALTESQLSQLGVYARLLLRWNSVYNLTSIEKGQFATHHLLDSLAIVGEIHVIVGDRAANVLDVGAGGGLPGIPLAIAMQKLRVTLIDKVQKKVAFLTQAKLEIGLENVNCVHARVEAWQPPVRFDLIVARAFASLAELVRLTRHVLAPSGCWLAMKGALPQGELDELARAAPELRARAIKLRVPRLDAERHLILLQPL